MKYTSGDVLVGSRRKVRRACGGSSLDVDLSINAFVYSDSLRDHELAHLPHRGTHRASLWSLTACPTFLHGTQRLVPHIQITCSNHKHVYSPRPLLGPTNPISSVGIARKARYILVLSPRLSGARRTVWTTASTTILGR